MRFSASKEELRKLYWDKKLSTAEIAKKYNCTHSAIIYKMETFRIKRRTKLGLRKPVKISSKLLKNLYEDKKLSETKIAKILGCSRGAVEKRMKLYAIKPRNYRESNTRYPKKDFNGNKEQKAYMIGFRLGDLSISRRRYLIHVGCSSTRQEQVELIKNLFSPYTFVYTKPSRVLNGRQVIDIQCLLNESFNFLLPKKDNIEKWILKNEKCFFAFIAGYIDAEGHIAVRLPNKGKMPFSIVEIQTYDKNILFQMWRKLNQIKINCPKPTLNRPAGYISKSGIRSNKNTWRLTIAKKVSLLNLFKQINPYLKHGKRRKDMEKSWNNVISRI